VTANGHREIGWFAITIEESKLPVVLQGVFPAGVEVFHWHGDTFEIPDGAIKFASSEACSNQGFILNGRVIGLQFHIETTEQSAALLIKNCSDELDGSTYVQSAAVMMENPARFKEINRILFTLLEKLTKQA
jgi:GMP synthase-like glutamine amidotransferase